MEYRAIFLPQAWLENASLVLARLDNGQSCHLLFPLESYLDSGERYFSSLPMDQIHSALLVFPFKYQNPSYQHLWPKWIQSRETGFFCCAFIFSGSLDDFLTDFEKQPICKFPDSFMGTCQYEPPYTDQLDSWEMNGVRAFHPGDYYKNEVMEILADQGEVWLYWGHGDWDRLRGYGHLEKKDLQALKRKKPFAMTLWFSCSTLDFTHGFPIAWEWYQQGKTKSLFCSSDKISTQANQLFASQLLQKIIECKHEQNIAELLLWSFEAKKEELNPVQESYYLLGNPWIGIGKNSIG